MHARALAVLLALAPALAAAAPMKQAPLPTAQAPVPALSASIPVLTVVVPQAQRFEELARRVYLVPAGAPEALSLAELRRDVEKSVNQARDWKSQAVRLSGREGGEDVGKSVAAAAAVFDGVATLDDLDEDPSLEAGRDDMMITAAQGVVDALGKADRKTMSKAARRDHTRMTREAHALVEDLTNLKALIELQPPKPVADFPDDLDRSATLMGHLTLRHRRDLATKNASLAMIHDEERKGRDSGRQIFTHASMLDLPEVSRVVGRMPAGARAMVVGDGRAGPKAVKELLALNPNIEVTLLVTDASGLMPQMGDNVKIVLLGKKPTFGIRSDPKRSDLTLQRTQGGVRFGTRLYGSGVDESFDGPLVLADSL